MNNMAILEELLTASKEYNQYEGNKYYKAIETLIAENKELKEKLEERNSKIEERNSKIFELLSLLGKE